MFNVIMKVPISVDIQLAGTAPAAHLSCQLSIPTSLSTVSTRAGNEGPRSFTYMNILRDYAKQAR